MTFEEILDQALAMVQRRGRVTYSALKRQFDLDEALLEDLKEELLYGQRLVTEEDGRVLVWRGDASPPGTSVTMAAPHPESADSEPHQRGTSPPTGARPSDAERRHLTVLFCDLVDSTALARQLDPEDLREVVRAYQDTCARVIARYDGHIAQYLGDGLLVYFGYPQAHEDDAQRAVRAGLGMLEAVGQLTTRLAQEWGVHLDVRLGVHTGLVVVGEVGVAPGRNSWRSGRPRTSPRACKAWPRPIPWWSVAPRFSSSAASLPASHSARHSSRASPSHWRSTRYCPRVRPAVASTWPPAPA